MSSQRKTPEPPPGLYTHPKGGTYVVLAVATDATNDREGHRVVVYIACGNGQHYVRDLAEFTEDVPWPDGVVRPRFVPAPPEPKRGSP